MICPECNGTGTAIYYCRETGHKFEDICHTCCGARCKPQTNADRIRAMSDEELAEWLYKFFWGRCKEISPFNIEKWLRQPVKGGEGE